ncbi:hypothetical protein PF007_g21359 [Phytophthora fragariae]|uniref:Uncharacterized protein n=1 Tax=Phytophthora fragariae TaxID=53985 RepID=A0A6A3R0F0_9STRA|nr:hypothetical protein PF007_g21359 [Phytophthora fragariae]
MFQKLKWDLVTLADVSKVIEQSKSTESAEVPLQSINNLYFHSSGCPYRPLLWLLTHRTEASSSSAIEALLNVEVLYSFGHEFSTTESGLLRELHSVYNVSAVWQKSHLIEATSTFWIGLGNSTLSSCRQLPFAEPPVKVL